MDPIHMAVDLTSDYVPRAGPPSDGIDAPTARKAPLARPSAGSYTKALICAAGYEPIALSPPPHTPDTMPDAEP